MPVPLKGGMCMILFLVNPCTKWLVEIMWIIHVCHGWKTVYGLRLWSSYHHWGDDHPPPLGIYCNPTFDHGTCTIPQKNIVGKCGHMWPLLCRWNPQDVSCQIMKFQGPPRHTNALCAVQSVLPITEPSQVNRPCTGPRWERACGQKRSKKQVLNYPSM